MFYQLSTVRSQRKWRKLATLKVLPDFSTRYLRHYILHTNYFQQLKLFLNHKIVTLQQHIYLCAYTCRVNYFHSLLEDLTVDDEVMWIFLVMTCLLVLLLLLAAVAVVLSSRLIVPLLLRLLLGSWG